MTTDQQQPAPRERFKLVIECVPDSIPGDVRLRAALKRLWRSHRIRCIEIAPAPEDDRS